MDAVADATVPAVELPPGGGAIRGIGEKFAVSSFSGTGSLSVPVATSPGRSGFGPRLILSYDSGFGNGIVGLGWTLDLPTITRKTQKGLPTYDDASESDVFVLSGAEDLVPADVPEVRRGPYRVRRYRPRVESGFTRIERWTNGTDPGDVFWRTISADNVLTRYGGSDESRIRDPGDPTRIFSWLICEQQDDKGNAVVYGYRPDDGLGVDPARPNERNRGPADDPRRAVNRYPKRIRYGNRRTLLDADGRRPPTLEADLGPDAWMFEVVFDYGDHDPERPTPQVQQPWPFRADAFSTRRPGFEVRTTRRCRRVLMFHHFPDEPGVGRDCLVRSTDLTYADDPAAGARYSLLTSIIQTGYRRDGEGYLSRSLPPLEFGYTEPVLHDEVRTVASSELGNLPVGISGPGYAFVDLHGEGVAGVLATTSGEWSYQRNESPGVEDDVRFGPMGLLPSRPNRTLDDRNRLLDLAGDGSIDLVSFDGPVSGFYEHDEDDGWQPFVAFDHPLNRDVRDPNLRFIDLDGDGRTDVLITEDDALVWHRSLDEHGFEAERRRPMPPDDEAGPRLVFADQTESIHLADMTGDGLTDVVRVRNGDVSYWPNLGYGAFGARVTMDRTPRLDADDLFSPQRVRLADLDGTGTGDLVYLDDDGVRLFFNRSGNGWSSEHRLGVTPGGGDLVDVSLVDLLGNGTTCLVWSSSLPMDVGRQVRYVDLLGGTKPFLLTRVANNLGAETHLSYAPSTRFCVRDRLAGRPWVTRLPFPVQVVERVETLDLVGRNRFTTQYAYHHGYFDPDEREFRGFALVEQWDREAYDSLPAAERARWMNLDDETDVPPAYTKTWYHTGACVGRAGIPGYAAAPRLPDAELPAGLSADERREACRALRGVVLRREVYALDGTDREPHPYVVTEQNHRVRLLQPCADHRHAVVHAHQLESVTSHFERDPDDPRVEQAITLEVDDYGIVLRDATIAYGRRRPDAGLPTDADWEVQARALVSYSEHAATHAIDDAERHPDDYTVPRPAENLTYELTGIARAGGSRLRPGDLDRASVRRMEEIGYRQEPDHATPQRRVVDHTRVLYRPDDLGAAAGDADALLPLGRVGVRAVPGLSFALAFTDELVGEVYAQDGRPLIQDTGLRADEGGYVSGRAAHDRGWFPPDAAGRWWLPTGRTFLSPPEAADPAAELAYATAHFFLPLRHRDPLYRRDFNTESTVTFDAYDLLPASSTDAVGNTVRVSRQDYRVLRAAQLTDPNGNRSEVAFDALGFVVGTASMGKPGERRGDTLDGFVADLDEAVVRAHLDDPFTDAATLLAGAGSRIVYDLWAYARAAPADPRPSAVATLVRERHVADLEPGEESPIQHSLSYCDGFGRVVQAKGQAEPVDGRPRWVGTGWVILNNQGKPVRRYEPFFTDSHRFEFDLRVGVSALVAYDPLGRAIATIHPDGSYDKLVFGTWRLETWDVNDTVLLDPHTDSDLAGYATREPAGGASSPTWYARRIGGQLGPDAQRAAERAAAHAATPGITHGDPAGRPFLVLADNGVDASGRRELLATRRELDIEGNDRAVRDADDRTDPRGRVVMRHDFDMVGRLVHRWSPDSGDRWVLDDATGRTIRNWDARGHAVRTTYDTARRKLATYVTGADPDAPGHEALVGLLSYGEDQPDGTERNLRGRVARRLDQAGSVVSAGYDFKGNLLATTRRLAADFAGVVDWSGDPAVEDDAYENSSEYDALNRTVSSTRPAAGGAGRSSVRYAYDRSNRLVAVDVRHGADGGWTPLVSRIAYNPKGQRVGIAYGNGAETRYDYDPETFRLTRLRTRRPRSEHGRRVQDLRYTYDPVGNVSHIGDDARQAVFFDNIRVGADRDYAYDPTYRLVNATGREHLGQAGTGAPGAFDPRRASTMRQPGDGTAMARYAEDYRYDPAGNLTQLRHRRSEPSDPGWARRFRYAPSGNRLAQTVDGRDAPLDYAHDEHGNLVAMPHLAAMSWDYRDQLAMTQRQHVDEGAAERTYYVYDGDGRRTRKVTVGPDGRPREECVYLDGVEIQRVHRGARKGLLRHTLDVSDGARRIALVEESRDGGPEQAPTRLLRYQLGDHLGSSVVELDGEARVISYEEYGAFGGTTYAAVRGDLDAPKRYRYNGKERDGESGFTYYGARYYAAWLARWASCDPVPLVDGTNPYAYARNNPVRYVDPTGAFVEGAAAAGGAALLNEAAAAATGALTLMGADVVVPEPTDLVPYKWVAYAVVGVVAVGVLGGIAAYTYFSDPETPAPPADVPHPPEVKPPEAPPTEKPFPEAPQPETPPVVPPVAPPVAPPTRPPVVPPVGPVVPPVGPVAPPVGPAAPPAGPAAPPAGPAAPPVTDAPGTSKPVPDEKTRPKEGTDDPPPTPAPEDEEEPRRPTIRVYRVETEFTNPRRVVIGTGGTVTILGPDDSVLWLNFGQPQRAEDYARKKIREGAKDVKIRSFEVPLEFYAGLLAIAVPERGARRRENRWRPVISADKPRGTQLGLKAAQTLALRFVIIQGTGREESRP
jgi:RHS repeat-associated protein